jgi:glucose dehydrogenase
MLTEAFRDQTCSWRIVISTKIPQDSPSCYDSLMRNLAVLFIHFIAVLARLLGPGGAVNLGGPMATAGGLVFTSATIDPHLHAFDSETGKELWNYELPAGAQATPMTYTWKGKQYLVISAGGHGKLGSKQGDYVIAFTLP